MGKLHRLDYIEFSIKWKRYSFHPMIAHAIGSQKVPSVDKENFFCPYDIVQLAGLLRRSKIILHVRAQYSDTILTIE